MGGSGRGAGERCDVDAEGSGCARCTGESGGPSVGNEGSSSKVDGAS